jgi:hypothetical protein
MDRTERVFKIGIDLILTIILGSLLSLVSGISWIWAVVLGFLVAHTLNFLFNGQVWVVLKHFDLVSHSQAEFEQYLRLLSERVRAEPSIQWAAAYGSLVRGEWHEHSDLDVRLLRQAGFWHGLRACWFVVAERTRALLSTFPLDMFVLDGSGKLAKLRSDEQPFEIKPL